MLGYNSIIPFQKLWFCFDVQQWTLIILGSSKDTEIKSGNCSGGIILIHAAKQRKQYVYYTQTPNHGWYVYHYNYNSL